MRIARRLVWPLMVLVLAVTAAALPDRLVPVGRVVGIQLDMDGVVVAGFSEQQSSTAGLQIGDRICGVNGQEVDNVHTLQQVVNHSNGALLTLNVVRDGTMSQFALTPCQTAEGYRLGLLVRDGAAGIGTITFYNPDSGRYGALGHGISDQKTGQLLETSGGILVEASVAALTPGVAGTPGELKGAYQTQNVIGTVECNTDCGIFGVLSLSQAQEEALPVATLDEIVPGPAKIQTNVEGRQICQYDVEILKVYAPGTQTGKDMMLHITDPALLEKTGGIVQGMSGSPILQDGKLIGAVTHVLIGDPAYGYGVSIQTMLDGAGACGQQAPAA